MKIITIIGARPQFIKAASLSRYIRNLNNSVPKKLLEIIVHTGQHYDYNMNDTFFRELEIPEPDYNLGIGSGTPAWQTSKMMMEIEKVLLLEKPDVVIVYGDTNSTLAGSLSAVKLNIPVAHVEAGLRSYDRAMPEEINRIITDTISTILFCPTKNAVNNLKKEGMINNVYLVGDIMLETFQYYVNKAQNNSKILKNLQLYPKDYYLCTIHRASNTDNLQNLKNILTGLTMSQQLIILPLHPRTNKVIEQNSSIKSAIGNNLKLISPVGYLDMIVLEKMLKRLLLIQEACKKKTTFVKFPVSLCEKTPNG